jgi:hypothetical protein
MTTAGALRGWVALALVLTAAAPACRPAEGPGGVQPRGDGLEIGG